MSTRRGHNSTNLAEQKVAQPMENIAQKLTAEDLEALADEASRMGLSLACLIGALEDDAEILWMQEEPHGKGY